MSEKRLIKSISDIAEEQIGTDYISTREIESYITDSDKFLCVTGIKDKSHMCTEVNPKNTEFDVVTGFIRGRIVPKQTFTIERFNLPEVEADTVFEVLTWAVDKEYQGQHLGLALTNKMSSCILNTDVFPVVSPVRKPKSDSTDHLEFLSQYGDKVRTVDTKPESVNCAVCIGECSCKTVILTYNQPSMEQLHTDTTALLDETVKMI